MLRLTHVGRRMCGGTLVAAIVLAPGLAFGEDPPGEVWRGLLAQDAAAGGTSPLLAPAAPVPGIPEDLPCPDCAPPKRPLWGFAELMIVQLIPSAINNGLRDAEWARISPDSWYNNMVYPWKWDDNAFLNNQFSHPYHGNLYFNAARSNGFNFWASAPWAFGGSAMWELYGESWAPSPNDLWNTSLGGIALGETLFRLSNLTLDNTATGSERVWREIGGVLLNPIGGFNRLIEGKMNDVTANPTTWRPGFIQAAFDLGYRRIGDDDDVLGDLEEDQVFIQARLFYGDLMKDIVKSPFSHFRLAAELSNKESQGERGRLSQLTARGTLAGVTLGGDENGKSQHRLGALMRYEYYNNPAYEFGGQSFAGGWFGRFGEGTFQTRTEALLAFYPIAATRSDYFITEEGRDYDYGIGGGMSLSASFIWWPRVFLTLGYVGVNVNTLDGEESEHWQGGGMAELRVQITKSLGVGSRYFNYHRKSVYEGQPSVELNSPSLSFYVGLAVPAAQ